MSLLAQIGSFLLFLNWFETDRKYPDNFSQIKFTESKIALNSQETKPFQSETT